MKTGSTILLALALAAAACERGTDEGPGEAARVGAGGSEGVEAEPETRALTEGLAMWRANGFTMLVPESADIIPRRTEPPATWGSILAGPGFVREVEGGREAGPPAYRLDATTYEKPDTIALEAWVAARLAERGESAGPGVTVAIAGEPALRTGAAPREPGPASYWLEREGTVVEFHLTEEPESPLAGIQRHMQSLMLSTFRWSEEGLSGEAR
jgi:hypothetical protein